MVSKTPDHWLEMTSEEFLNAIKPPKFGNNKVEADGYTFDSGAEYRHYRSLLLRVSAGDITHLKIHPPFVIIPAFKDRDGKRVQQTVYEADFSYREVTSPGTLVVEDVKGARTEAFNLKWKLMKQRYPLHDLRIIPAKEA